MGLRDTKVTMVEPRRTTRTVTGIGGPSLSTNWVASRCVQFGHHCGGVGTGVARQADTRVLSEIVGGGDDILRDPGSEVVQAAQGVEEGCQALRRKDCAAEPLQDCCDSFAPFAVDEPSTARHLLLCRATNRYVPVPVDLARHCWLVPPT